LWVGLALAIALVSRWVCVAMACAKSVGENLSTVAVRWADMVRILIRSRVPSFIFCFPVPRCIMKRSLVPRGEFELVECHPLIFSCLRKRVFVGLVVTVRGAGRALALTFVHKQWREFEARHCPTTPNVF